MGGLPSVPEPGPDRRFFTKGVQLVNTTHNTLGNTDFRTLESHIRRARIERSVAVAQSLVAVGETLGRALRGLYEAVGRGLEAERDRRAVEADAFLKRSVPRY